MRPARSADKKSILLSSLILCFQFPNPFAAENLTSASSHLRKKIEKGVNDLGREQGDKEVEMKAELNQLQEEMAEMKKNVKKKLSRARRVHGKLANWLDKAETLEGRTELD